MPLAIVSNQKAFENVQKTACGGYLALDTRQFERAVSLPKYLAPMSFFSQSLRRTLQVRFRLSLHLQRRLFVVLRPRINLANLVLSTRKHSLGQLLAFLSHESALFGIADLARTLLSAGCLAFARYHSCAGVKALSLQFGNRFRRALGCFPAESSAF
jgi:hypothetical protein